MKDFIQLKCQSELLAMNLQLFGDEPGGSGGDAGGSGSNDPGGSEPISFANQSEYDSAVDKRIDKALETAKAKWDTEHQAAIDAAKTEAERLAQLSAEEKAAEEARLKLEEDNKRLADITRRELRLEALETLAEKDLPKELIDAVVLSDADACKKSIESVEVAFRAAVEVGVNARLAASASTPPGNQTGGKGESLGSQAAKAANERTAPKTNLWS